MCLVVCPKSFWGLGQEGAGRDLKLWRRLRGKDQQTGRMTSTRQHVSGKTKLYRLALYLPSQSCPGLHRGRGINTRGLTEVHAGHPGWGWVLSLAHFSTLFVRVPLDATKRAERISRGGNELVS